MLAARQAGGFPSPTATNFCTCCNLKIQDIENLDRSTWPERDVVQQIQLAKRWRDAESLEEQERLFRIHGVRWSPFLDLPYWNPVLFTAIEPMHLFETGLFQTHCRQVWRIDVSAPGGDESRSAGAIAVPRPSNSDMEKWYEVIRAAQNPTKLQEQLNGRKCVRDILWHICNDHNLRRAGNKGQLAGSIVEWVSGFRVDWWVRQKSKTGHSVRQFYLMWSDRRVSSLPSWHVQSFLWLLQPLEQMVKTRSRTAHMREALPQMTR